MRRTAGLVAAAALAVGASAPAGESMSTHPTLRLLDTNPVAFRGVSFKRGERVRVTVASGEQKVVRLARASSVGTFTATFATATFDPCSFSASAVGSRGSRATFKLPQRLSERMCPLPLGEIP